MWYNGLEVILMPVVSRAQDRFMHAVKEGNVKGVKPSVGSDFISASHGMKMKDLPERVGKPGSALKPKYRKPERSLMKLRRGE